ncbi:archaetidylserine decarboxylase [Salisediminibacterium halotolerans]|uniref:phosphatidylserine decarboxylase n=1 Tax=Salisediminibacterium halotolerans TaxID=517425 RepID=A0A1H9S330_9BACI|nr:archaetidylserine decarboxylase [Salisediminibacterium haloalkalitolerans]SER79338.1 phosphatidylserine decarboxylase [Salisediminibacterium haloalkalitolerans]
MKKLLYKAGTRVMQAALFVKVYKQFTGSLLSRPLIRPFIYFSGINEAEIRRPKGGYKTLRQLFTRELPLGTRPVNQKEDVLVSPADGTLTAAGDMEENSQFTVKGAQQTIQDLLRFPQVYQTYQNGSFAVIYLSPKDYHRVHIPLAGTLRQRYALGEKSEPVNDLGFHFGKSPLVTNHRIISEYQTAYGKIAVIKVGALNVNSVDISARSLNLEKGEEMARFSLGSTVIILTETSGWNFRPSGGHLNTACRVGEEIARFQGEWR